MACVFAPEKVSSWVVTKTFDPTAHELAGRDGALYSSIDSLFLLSYRCMYLEYGVHMFQFNYCTLSSI